MQGSARSRLHNKFDINAFEHDSEHLSFLFGSAGCPLSNQPPNPAPTCGLLRPICGPQLPNPLTSIDCPPELSAALPASRLRHELSKTLTMCFRRSVQTNMCFVLMYSQKLEGWSSRIIASRPQARNQLRLPQRLESLRA